MLLNGIMLPVQPIIKPHMLKSKPRRDFPSVAFLRLEYGLNIYPTTMMQKNEPSPERESPYLLVLSVSEKGFCDTNTFHGVFGIPIGVDHFGI